MIKSTLFVKCLVFALCLLSFGKLEAKNFEIMIDNTSHSLVAEAGACSYQWYRNGAALDGETDRFLSVEEGGNYKLEVVDEIGVVATTNVTVAVTALGAIVKIYTIGDSTVSTYGSGEYPRMGWGQVLQAFFNTANVQVVNKAQSGASSKSFYNSYWTAVKNVLVAGDFVLIQFGHNDSKNGTQDDIDNRYTDPSTTYKQYLTKYVNEIKAKGAFPVFVTSTNRNWWKSGVIDPLADYPPAMKALATSLNIPLIDLTSKSATLFNSLGQAYTSRFIFNNLQAGEYPNYADGNEDNTHFQEMGAIEMARLVAQGVSELSADANVKTLISYLKPQYKITVSVNPVGSDVMTTRTASYPAGLTVTLKTVPKTAGTFQKWNNASNTSIATAVLIKVTSGTVATSYSAIYKGAVIGVVDCNNTANGTATLDNCGRCISGTTGKTACSSVAEAETEACAFDGITETKNEGFKGTSYLNVDNAVGTAITFNITATNAGAATLSFRYANGGTADRPAQISLNGTVLANNLGFPITEDFTTWKSVDLQLTLLKGNNVLKLLSSTAEGLANIDQIGYVSSGVSKGGCVITGTTNYENQTTNFNVYPNPTQNKISWKKEQSWVLLNSFGQELDKGKSTEIDLFSYAKGIYLLLINGQSVKIIKE